MSDTPAQSKDLPQGIGTLPGTRPEDEADAAAVLAELAPAVAPPDALFDAITAEIDAAEAGGSVTRRALEGTWVQLSPHLWKKILHEDSKTGQSIYYLRCAPGAVIPSHHHERDEHALVLEGWFEVDGQTVRAGDTHFSPAGTTHAPLSAPEGCLLLLHA
ncbi:MAG: cupin domain-containing protein [Pseudomonadota bacterium]